ncbi:MAG: hypothetical protein ACP5N3_00185, partial [Candidatus Nanoarchaeia archaeon]
MDYKIKGIDLTPEISLEEQANIPEGFNDEGLKGRIYAIFDELIKMPEVNRFDFVPEVDGKAILGEKLNIEQVKRMNKKNPVYQETVAVYLGVMWLLEGTIEVRDKRYAAGKVAKSTSGALNLTHYD